VECVGVLESWVCRVGGGIEDYLESIGREGAGRRNGPGVGPEGVVDTSCDDWASFESAVRRSLQQSDGDGAVDGFRFPYNIERRARRDVLVQSRRRDGIKAGGLRNNTGNKGHEGSRDEGVMHDGNGWENGKIQRTWVSEILDETAELGTGMASEKKKKKSLHA
jgi:hypothetical protein